MISDNIELSIIIPVYNSENIIGKTTDILLIELDKLQVSFEIILVNDGSADDSWNTIKTIANKHNQITAINLLKNYGQHTAQYCALRHCQGKYIVTMDDDMQNHPDQIVILYNKILEGYDLVIGKFHSKKHAYYRSVGTQIINYFNQKIFDKPKNIHLTNFRIFDKRVSDRLLNYNTNYPYIPGLLLMYSSSIANVPTTHHKREVGKSNYSITKIIKLVSRLLINYSSYPLKVLTFIGLTIAVLSFLIGFYILFIALYSGYSIPGWASIMVLMSFLNGITILISGVLGIYISRTLEQVSKSTPYIIEEIVK